MIKLKKHFLLMNLTVYVKTIENPAKRSYICRRKNSHEFILGNDIFTTNNFDLLTLARVIKLSQQQVAYELL